MSKKIRVLIADDSFFMRTVLSDILSSSPQMVVAGTAREGREALAKTLDLKPDIITMDLDMPGMGGLEAVERIMSECPTPILVVSAHVKKGGEMTIRALEAGAVDFVPKPQAGGLIHMAPDRQEFLSKILQVNEAKVGVEFPTVRDVKRNTDQRLSHPSDGSNILVTIGASAGGPKALAEIFKQLPGELRCSVVVVQHMPQGFTYSLAERLNAVGELVVREARDGDVVEPGVAFVAPGGGHVVLRSEGDEIRIRSCVGPSVKSATPSIDLFMLSAVESFGSHVLAVVLSGMGSDGAMGSRTVYEAGGRVLAQDEGTSVVYGMPKSAAEMGCVEKQVPIQRMAGEILREISYMNGSEEKGTQ